MVSIERLNPALGLLNRLARTLAPPTDRDRIFRQDAESTLFLHEAEGHFDEAADPEFFIGVGAVEHGLGLKADAEAVPGSAVVEAGFDGILVFADLARVDDIVRG